MPPQEKRPYTSIFWVDVDKIRPNPYQPRKEFDEEKLRELADSIRQYGVLQPLVVTRHEETREDGGIHVYYELIAGERRTRAARIAGVQQVPVLIREGDAADAVARLKLELAIIENLQREDLSPVERARAFKRLVEEFGFKHAEIGKKVGKSREYVANTIRLLALPDEMIMALEAKKITEGHTRPLLMLSDKKEEQVILFKDIMYKRLNVREAELTARAIATERARKPVNPNPEFVKIENELVERLGTRVRLEQKNVGGKIIISFFSDEDLRNILDTFLREHKEKQGAIPEGGMPLPPLSEDDGLSGPPQEQFPSGVPQMPGSEGPQFYTAAAGAESDSAGAESDSAGAGESKKKEDEGDLYSIKNFSI